MCLALIVSIDKNLPERFRQLTVFYMCGMVMLTILINGLTCKKIINYI
jgi:NhaP-type Na+/H+ or K+/H+ antiporter